MNGPLSGVRVLDLTSVLMGPYCTQQMGVMGADVIKVERPEGDTTRYVGKSRSEGMGPLFLNFNRDKRSAVLDLKDPDARDDLLALAADCDVFIHSMRPAAVAKLGLTYEDLARARPDIVYCAAYGFGQEGPYSHKPAYDDMVQGASGLAAIQGTVAGEPQYVASTIVDKICGMTALQSVLAALLHRERTGEGQAVDVPMFETMASFMLAEHSYGRTFEPPLGQTGYPRAASPDRKPYPTADGYVCLLPYTDRQWARFFGLTGHAELIEDTRFATLNARTENIDELYRLVATLTEDRTTAEWLQLGEQADIPTAPVNSLDDLYTDPHLDKVGFFDLHEHPTEGWLRQTRHPVAFSKTPAGSLRATPRLGEHTGEIIGLARRQG